jgi:hypothetical protein
LLPDALPAAWKDGTTTALSGVAALSQKAGRNLPWATVRTALDGAFRARVLERVEGSGTWPADYAGAGGVTIQLPSEKKVGITTGGDTPQRAVPADTRVSAEVVLKANQLQDLTDLVPELLRADSRARTDALVDTRYQRPSAAERRCSQNR